MEKGLATTTHSSNLQLAQKNIHNWTKTLSDPIRYVEHESRLTVRGNLRGRSIDTMIRLDGAPRSHVVVVVDLLLKKFLDSINVSTQLNDNQKMEIAITLTQQYPHETLNDFALCFRMVKLGHFGPIYNRIDISVIMEWMRRYMDHKAFELENVNREIPVVQMLEPLFKRIYRSRMEYYTEKLGLKFKLDDLAKHHERMGSLGIYSLNNGRGESDFREFREDYLKRQKQNNNDIRAGGTMGGHDVGTTDRNVPVSNGTGGDGIEPIPGT